MADSTADNRKTTENAETMMDEEVEETTEINEEVEDTTAKLNKEIDSIIVEEGNTLSVQNQLGDNDILKAVLDRETAEMRLRNNVAKILISLMCTQVVAINMLIFLMGLNLMVFKELEPLRWLFVFVIAEVIGLVTVIVKYLFSDKQNKELQSYIESYHPDSTHRQLGEREGQIVFGE